jgi:hypothetical protein
MLRPVILKHIIDEAPTKDCGAALLGARMDAEHIDRLARVMATGGNRRALLSTAAGLVGAAVGTRLGLHGMAAAGLPAPPTGFTDWTVCPDAQSHYCIAAFSANGVDQLTVANPDFLPQVSSAPNFGSSGPAVAMFWSVNTFGSGIGGQLTEEDLGANLVLRVRSGLLRPHVSFGFGKLIRITTRGDAASGWEFEVRGQPGLRALSATPGPVPAERASSTQVAFNGNVYDRSSTLAQHLAFEGYWNSTAGTVSSPSFNRDRQGWQVTLANSHFMPDGVSLFHGYYSAWIAPGALAAIGLTADEAVAGGLEVTRADGAVVAPVAATLLALDGGAFIEIPDLTFSSPTILMARRGQRGCTPRCRKGRVCKQGRCVAKRKKGKGKRKGNKGHK